MRIHIHMYICMYVLISSPYAGCRDLFNSGGTWPLRIVMQIKMQSKDKTRIDLLAGCAGRGDGGCLVAACNKQTFCGTD